MVEEEEEEDRARCGDLAARNYENGAGILVVR